MPYLSRNAIATTLSAIARIPDGEVVFDYGEPVDALPPDRRARYEVVIRIVKAWGEPWVSFFTPSQMKQGLTKLGFLDIEDLGPAEIGARYPGAGQLAALHLIRARAP